MKVLKKAYHPISRYGYNLVFLTKLRTPFKQRVFIMLRLRKTNTYVY